MQNEALRVPIAALLLLFIPCYYNIFKFLIHGNCPHGWLWWKLVGFGCATHPFAARTCLFRPIYTHCCFDFLSDIHNSFSFKGTVLMKYCDKIHVQLVQVIWARTVYLHSAFFAWNWFLLLPSRMFCLSCYLSCLLLLPTTPASLACQTCLHCMHRAQVLVFLPLYCTVLKCLFVIPSYP
jgi:hypothetical protein